MSESAREFPRRISPPDRTSRCVRTCYSPQSVAATQPHFPCKKNPSRILASPTGSSTACQWPTPSIWTFRAPGMSLTSASVVSLFER